MSMKVLERALASQTTAIKNQQDRVDGVEDECAGKVPEIAMEVLRHLRPVGEHAFRLSPKSILAVESSLKSSENINESVDALKEMANSLQAKSPEAAGALRRIAESGRQLKVKQAGESWEQSGRGSGKPVVNKDTSQANYASSEAAMREVLNAKIDGDNRPELVPGKPMDEVLAVKVFGWTKIDDNNWSTGFTAGVKGVGPFSTEEYMLRRVPEEFQSLGATAQNKHVVLKQELAKSKAQGIDTDDPLEVARIGVRAMERFTNEWVAFRILGWDGYPGEPGVKPPGSDEAQEAPAFSTDRAAAQELWSKIYHASPRIKNTFDDSFTTEFMERMERKLDGNGPWTETLPDEVDPWDVCQAALRALNPNGSTFWPEPPLADK